MKKIALVFVLLAVSSSVFSAPAELRLGIDPTFPPFESKDAQGNLVGFDVDLGKSICEKINRKCVFVENTFDGLIPALKAKKFDAILSSLSINEERKKSIDFSSALFTTPVYLITHRQSGLSASADTLKGKRVGVQQGSVFETYANKYWRDNGVNVVPYASSDQVYADLALGRLDATLDDAASATVAFLDKLQGAGFELNGREVFDKDLFGKGTGLGLRKGDDKLRESIDQAIAEIKTDGTFSRLNKQYFTFDVSPRS
ncbi:transporter substrate-binding domain-containing protein [Acerihabitans arboris]|uniref:Transporter substrate-binding domain-containing protein n=1 Tax=Acerihabitans arboris TaxID=2691583 RepID=A0A845SFQ8_9GAMM|nr:transporter substrate-binding domain-containing protein [Acerihabitans arboris]NDL61774.1 transporter substrate-binding domain-containing protein [Acerihabitans arboris]